MLPFHQDNLFRAFKSFPLPRSWVMLGDVLSVVKPNHQKQKSIRYRRHRHRRRVYWYNLGGTCKLPSRGLSPRGDLSPLAFTGVGPKSCFSFAHTSWDGGACTGGSDDGDGFVWETKNVAPTKSAKTARVVNDCRHGFVTFRYELRECSGKFHAAHERLEPLSAHDCHAKRHLLKPGGCYMLTCSAPPGLHISLLKRLLKVEGGAVK